MTNSPEDLQCTVPVNMILDLAHRIYSYDKTPLALALIHVVLEQHPGHPQALLMKRMYAGDSPE
ncbi:MAG: hypothetical protein K8S20_04715 [Chloroflexi bacterium]|nr:hypothetical protein [Chloroflexota bacterium]